MGNSYKHLTELDRIFIELMLRKGYSKEKIAKTLKVHRSTIYREIKRNSINWNDRAKFYLGSSAQKRYIKRCGRGLLLEKDIQLQAYVHEKLREGWSPWQIEGRLRQENAGKSLVTHETIYQYIYSNYSLRNQFYKRLRRKHFLRIKRYSRNPRIPKELLIDNRPSVIKEREKFGHWECDLMIFKRGIKSNLITLRERKSRYLLAIKNADKTAQGTALTLISSLKSYKGAIKSITFDQGGEFLKYEWIKTARHRAYYFGD